MKNTYQHEILKFNEEREVGVNIYDNKIMEFKNGEVVYMFIPVIKAKVKPTELKCSGITFQSPDYMKSKGFVLILNDDGTFTRISIENLKPEDSEKMKEYGFNVVFDDNNNLRFIEDTVRGYSIGYAPWCAQINSFRSPYFK